MNGEVYNTSATAEKNNTNLFLFEGMLP